jgi:hypothetical protein
MEYHLSQPSRRLSKQNHMVKRHLYTQASNFTCFQRTRAVARKMQGSFCFKMATSHPSEIFVPDNVKQDFYSS